MAERIIGVGASLHAWGWTWQSPDIPAPTIGSNPGAPPRAGWILVEQFPEEPPDAG